MALSGAWMDAQGADRGMAQRAPFLPSFALLILAYSLAAVAGLQWATVSGAASPIWPAAGVAVACILHAGTRVWPGIVIGLLIATQVTGAAHPFWSQLMMGFGNAAAAVVAAELVKRYAGPHFSDFTTVRSVMLLLVAALAGAALSAVNGAAALTLAGAITLPQAPLVAETWLFGDAAGILLISAMIVSWRAARRSDWRPLNVSHLLLVCGAVALLSWFVFFGSSQSRAWAIYPALVWAALALRVQGASVALVVATVLACAGTALGLGPFAMAPEGQPDYLLLQQFLGVTTATTLLLAAAVDERNAEAKLRGMADRELEARELALGAQDRLRLALEASATGMWEWDVGTGSTSWSPEVYPIMGVPPGGFDGSNEAFDALLHPDDRERVWGSVTAALEQRRLYSCEFRIVRPDGEVRWVANRGRGLYDLDGKPLRMVGTITDITAATEQRQELERSSTMLQLIGASAPIALYAKDVEGRYIYANAVVAAATGTADGELVGRNDAHWAPPEVAAALAANDTEAMTSGDIINTEELIVHPDGEVRTYRALKAPLRDRSGEIIGLVGISTDITDQKEAQEQLARLAERAEIAQQAARSSLYEFHPATGAVARDPLIRELAGYSLAELPDDHLAWERIIHPEDLAEFRNTVQKVMERGERFAMEYRVGRRDGSTMWISDIGRIIRNADGSPERIIGMATDVTERKAAAEREQLLAREVDHRAKNLLTVVQSVIQMSRADTVENLRSGVLGRIQSLARAHSLLAAGRWESVDLAQLAAEELAPFVPADDASRIMTVGSSILLRPAAAQSLALVLHELATNAAKYGALRHDQGRLVLSWEREGEGRDAPVVIRWEEQGVPLTGPASSRIGFGTRVIQASVERQLKGQVTQHWSDGGLTVHLRVPPDHLLAVRPIDRMGAEEPA